MSEFRKDPVLDRWVIIAAKRSDRPQSSPTPGHTQQADSCPFCAGNESMTPPAVLVVDDLQRGDAPWSVRVVPNKYPALIDEEVASPSIEGLNQLMPAAGMHEVVIEHPNHVHDMAAFQEPEIERVLYAYQQRMLHFRGDPRWQYALIYKNQGVAAGATLAHCHSQVTALPLVPSEPRAEIEAARSYFASAACCIYCDILRREVEARQRIVAEDDHFIVYCPFASRVASETWIVPRRHSSCFEFAPQGLLRAMAHSLRDTLVRLNRRFGTPPFNFVLHSNPVSEPENDYYHWHLEILPKVQHVAGFEWGSGWYINPLPPEDAARELRAVKQ